MGDDHDQAISKTKARDDNRLQKYEIETLLSALVSTEGNVFDCPSTYRDPTF